MKPANILTLIGEEPKATPNYIITDKAIYRILAEDYRVLHTGGNSWMTLEEARKLVDRSKGEMIYEYTDDYQQRLFEVF